jgi:hypothetical protein
MSWVETQFEKAMKAYFESELGEVKAEELYGDYTSLRNALVRDNFFKEIKAVEPYLTDHSERHIQDVLERAYKLIGDFKEQKLSAKDIYSLALMILLHDVGNIFGRDGHDSIGKIAEVYNNYRQNPSNHREERKLVTFGASAHSGKSKKGCKDTLKYVEKGSIGGDEVNLPELAAILRFADELAEGKHRTCSFLIEHELIEKDSNIYHKYASITDIWIDRKLERIAITYYIDIDDSFNETELRELLAFTYYRAVKLDLERRYTKFYSDILKKIKRVTVQYNFTVNGIPMELDLAQIVFEDQYPIPGKDFLSTEAEAEEIFMEKNIDFKLSTIVEALKTKIKE